MSHFFTGIAQYKKNGVFHVELSPEPSNGNKDKIIIPIKYSKKSIHGDTVVVKKSSSNKLFGYVQRVLVRTKAPITGKLEKKGKFGFVKPLTDLYPVTFFVDVAKYEKENALLNDGDIVEVTVLDWKDSEKNPVASIVSKLISINADQEISYTQNLPVKFPTAVLQYCTTISNNIATVRQDLSKLNNFTLSSSKKDYNSMSFAIEHLKDGYNMYIHVSDLTTVVTPGSVLDIEAYYRGNSYSLVDTKIPMLPEHVHNIAAMSSKNDSIAAITCVIKLSNKFNISDVIFTKSYIKPAYEISIKEANKILNDGTSEAFSTLSLMSNFVKKIQKSILKSDILPQDIMEYPLYNWINHNGDTIPLRQDASGFYNYIKNIEIIVNKLAATYIDSVVSSEQKDSILYYSCNSIEENSLNKLKMKLSKASCSWEDEYTLEYNLLNIIKGNNESAKTLVHQYLPKSFYSVNSKNSLVDNSYYVQYTKPLDRYADIHTQRILIAAIDGRRIYSGNLEAVSEHLNHCLKKYRQTMHICNTKLMINYSNSINYPLNAVITNKTNKGYYIQTELPINGFVPVDDSILYEIGDKIRVKITERTHDKIFMQIL